MNDKDTSKFLSYVLRHKPDSIGIELDQNGWVSINTLLDASKTNRKSISEEQLLRIVANCDKQRYKISEDGLRIRASQGHSIDVDLEYKPAKSPSTLYHGTGTQFLDSKSR